VLFARKKYLNITKQVMGNFIDAGKREFSSIIAFMMAKKSNASAEILSDMTGVAT